MLINLQGELPIDMVDLDSVEIDPYCSLKISL